MLIYTIHSKLAHDNRKHNQNEIQLFKTDPPCYLVKTCFHFPPLCQSIAMTQLFFSLHGGCFSFSPLTTNVREDKGYGRYCLVILRCLQNHLSMGDIAWPKSFLTARRVSLRAWLETALWLGYISVCNLACADQCFYSVVVLKHVIVFKELFSIVNHASLYQDLCLRVGTIKARGSYSCP